MNLPTIPSWASVALKAAPYVVIAALAALLYLCHGNTSALKAPVAARDTQVSALIESREFFRKAVEQRDTLIDRQNSSIDALASPAAGNRDVYLKGLEAARAVSFDHTKAASELLSLKAPDGELAQCRAARDLLESELTK